MSPLPEDVEQRIADTPPEQRDLYRAVDFGLEVQQFIGSRLGQFLIERAEGERDEAVEQLKEADPFKPQGIRALQNRIWRAESVQRWMAEIIQAGIDAQRQLLEQEQD